MNTIDAVQVDYLGRASRTLETILLTNEKKQQKIVYMYNYEGWHFRIFENVSELSNFLNDQPHEFLREYSKERYADAFLENLHF
ncbi:MAG: hypothetical protein ABI378_00640 [Chitinophagaceae bacterium]